MTNRIFILILSGLLLGLSACQSEIITPDSGLTCPEGFDKHPKHAQFQELIEKFASEEFVGLTLLVDDSQNGLWMGGAGFADLEKKTKMTACHLHHTASIYKTYIAVIIMQLAEEGKLEINDHLDNYIETDILDKLPNGHEFTIKNLLEHRSGMQDIFEVEFIMDLFNDPLKDYTIREMLEYMYGTKAHSQPGTDFYYSDANYALLSLVIEKLEGDLEQAIDRRIIQSLGLSETHFITNRDAKIPGLANSYWDRYGNGQIENVSDMQIALTAGLKGSDGFIASANDMKIFIQAMVNGTSISDSSLMQMTHFQSVPPEDQTNHGISGYGLGLMQVNVSGSVWYGHLGNHVGSSAIALYNPEHDITLIAFQNTGTFFSDKLKPPFFYHLIREFEEIAF